MSAPSPERLVEKLAIENETRANEIAEAYKRVFATADGQVVLADLREFFQYESPSFLPPPSPAIPYDPLAAAVRDGQKSPITRIMRQITRAIDPEEKTKPNVITK